MSKTAPPEADVTRANLDDVKLDDSKEPNSYPESGKTQDNWPRFDVARIISSRRSLGSTQDTGET